MAIVLLNFSQIQVVQGPQSKYEIQNIYLVTFFNYYVQNKSTIFNIASVLIHCLHHVHRKSFK